jgi:formamidopyrimidine-DNA glycosylase
VIVRHGEHNQTTVAFCNGHAERLDRSESRKQVSDSARINWRAKSPPALWRVDQQHRSGQPDIIRGVPELPEVQSVVHTLRTLVTHRRVSVVRHLRSDMLLPAGLDLSDVIACRRIESVDRRAKRIVFTLDTRDRFYIHLGMTGQLTVEPADAPLKPHTHLILDLDDANQLRFVDPRRFGAIVWMGNAPHTRVGPEPLTLRPERLIRLLARTSRPIKTALLDQTLIAGIGNIYADEALHLAGIDPRRPACAVSADHVRRLNRVVKQVLRRAIRAGGSSIRDYVDANGSRGSFQTLHRVYDRTGEPCKRCKAPIQRITLGGRSTHFCPGCQSG